MVRSVRIVGAGLIGTSIGLALAAKNIAVEMIDVDSRNQALAQDLTLKLNLYKRLRHQSFR